MVLTFENKRKKLPQQFQQTVNNTGGAVDIVTDTGGDQVELLLINNTSTGGQIIYLGFGSDAVVGVNPVGQGFAWMEAIDQNYLPFSGRVSIIASADGATVSVQRRVM